jgi:hypothetical protein
MYKSAVACILFILMCLLLFAENARTTCWNSMTAKQNVKGAPAASAENKAARAENKAANAENKAASAENKAASAETKDANAAVSINPEAAAPAIPPTATAAPAKAKAKQSEKVGENNIRYF